MLLEQLLINEPAKKVAAFEKPCISVESEERLMDKFGTSVQTKKANVENTFTDD